VQCAVSGAKEVGRRGGETLHDLLEEGGMQRGMHVNERVLQEK